jgi:HD superfamily phosphodiesterase
MRDAILQVIPEIDWVKDKDLREKVIACHIDALKEGHWQLADLDVMPFALSIPNCPTSYLRHVRAVTRMCRSVLEEYNSIYKGQGDFVLDHDKLIAGALLHDIGKLLEWTKGADGKFGKSPEGKYLRHPLSGIVVAMRNGISSEIAHIIAYHAYEGDTAKRTPEAVIVNKIDMMNFDSIRSALGHL